MPSSRKCPFKVGEEVIFSPSERTLAYYRQILDKFGIHPGDKLRIKEIREDTYLYFESGKGGFPWNEFQRV